MRLYFIRHGQSVNNALYDLTQNSLGRNEDPELTDIGKKQAVCLAEFLVKAENERSDKVDHPFDLQNRNGFGLTHLYTSPMVRAVATGTIVSEALGLPLIMWEDLHEGGGIFVEDLSGQVRTGLPGKNRIYFEIHYPRLILPSNLNSEGWWNRPFEEEEDRLVRAQKVVRELISRHGDTQDNVAFFSHGGFYSYFMTSLIGLTNRNNIWFSLNNAGITRIDFLFGKRFITYQNRVDFLPTDLVT